MKLISGTKLVAKNHVEISSDFKIRDIEPGDSFTFLKLEQFTTGSSINVLESSQPLYYDQENTNLIYITDDILSKDFQIIT